MIYTQDSDGALRTVNALPDLSNAKRLSLDLETYDPNLKTTGASVRTGGWIAGIGVGAEDTEGKVQGWYIPIEHEGYETECFNKQEALEWLTKVLSPLNREVVLANALYDLDWLNGQHGITIKGHIVDIQGAEPLIDENAKTYSLNALSDKYLGESKVDDELYEYCAAHFGGTANRNQAGNIYRCPPEIVAKYGIGDVTLPLRIWREQRKVLDAEELWGVFNLEMELVPMLLDMKSHGVRVDIESMERIQGELRAKMGILQKQINEAAGIPIAIHENACLIDAYDRLGLTYGVTEKGNPSFTDAVLQQSEFGRQVSELRQLEKNSNVFLQGYIEKYAVGTRLHPEFNPLRSDDYGTVTGRFSSSKPNLQNIPKDELIRALYLPEEGQSWFKLDYSSVEYRIALHYGSGQAAEELRALYQEDANFDAHGYTASDLGIDRQLAKIINFGLIYGMGVKKLSGSLGVSEYEGKQILNRFHERVPFMQELLYKARDAAAERGYVHTLAGRRRRFDLYEPMRWKQGAFPLPLAQAKAEYGEYVKRGYTYKALNAIVQGGAADIMKKAMVDVYKSGVCDVIGVPMLTVHDELDFSVGDSPEHLEAIREVKHLMETAYELRVPLVVDAEKGTNWGNVQEVAL